MPETVIAIPSDILIKAAFTFLGGVALWATIKLMELVNVWKKGKESKDDLVKCSSCRASITQEIQGSISGFKMELDKRLEAGDGKFEIIDTKLCGVSDQILSLKMMVILLLKHENIDLDQVIKEIQIMLGKSAGDQLRRMM